MTLDQAIKLLERCYNTAPVFHSTPTYKAHKLGIEALKAWQRLEQEWRRPASMRLPGETLD